jgi:hypothetical protein
MEILERYITIHLMYDHCKIDKEKMFHQNLEDLHKFENGIVNVMENELKQAILEYITGARKELEISGPPRAIASLHEAIVSSKDLFVLLHENKNPSLISEAYKRRKVALERFKKETGDNWDI